MKETIIAKRYARALIAIAKKENSIPLLGKELELFTQTYTSSIMLKESLGNTHINFLARQNTLNQIGTKLGLSELMINSLKFLLKKNRISIIDTILNEYQALSNIELNQEFMTVITAHPLPENQYKEIENYFSQKTKKTMILKKQINKEVLGGVCVKIGDEVYDNTLETQLDELEEKLNI